MMTEQEIMKKVFPGRVVELDWSTYLSYLGAKAFLLKRLYDGKLSAREHAIFTQRLDAIERRFAESIYSVTEPNTFKIVEEINQIDLKLAQMGIVSRIIMQAAEVKEDGEIQQ